MRKFIFLILWVVLALPTGCSFGSSTFSITTPNVIQMNIGEEATLPYQGDLEITTWENSNPEAVLQDGLALTAQAPGVAVIKAIREDTTREYYVLVQAKIVAVMIEGTQNIKIGETLDLNAIISPLAMDQSVTWTSSDDTIATIDEAGLVTAVNTGLVTITATSEHDPTKFGQVALIVYDEIDLPTDGAITMEWLSSQITIGDVNFFRLMEPLIRMAEQSVIGVHNYLSSLSGSSLQYSGSGVIYQRDTVLKNDEIITDDSHLDQDDIKEFNYYVMTNRHVVKNASNLTIYMGKDFPEIPATLCQYDPKVDFAIIKFTSKYYFPIAKLGNSDELEAGEFVIAIGNPESDDYFRSASLGIVSYPKRYISDDTDGDEVADWHSEYIQHDAPINNGNSGGSLINMRGEVIGINTTKIIDDKVDNMGFAVPINLAQSLAPLLEQGIQPQRAVLGISVIEIKDIIAAPSLFPEITLPVGITYGLYVRDVTTGGLGSQAGLQAGDIILSFDDVSINYTYLFRIILVKHNVGSGDVVPMIIYRNGSQMTIHVTF